MQPASNLEPVRSTALEQASQLLLSVADSLNCDPPSSFDPLLNLLSSLTELAFIGGIGLGTIGFLVAGTFIVLPGQENTRRGKLIAKSVFIGTVLLLSAQLIVDFLVSQLAQGVICG